MENEKRKEFFIDINKAIKACLKCENFIIIPKQKAKIPIYFCSRKQENLIYGNEKYLPCILENISKECMANFLISNIEIEKFNIWKLD